MANNEKRIERLEGAVSPEDEITMILGSGVDIPSSEKLAGIGITGAPSATVIRVNGPETLIAIADCSLSEMLCRIDGKTRTIGPAQ